MERYCSYQGKFNPEFPHRVSINNVSDSMLHWCSTYRPVGIFDRYYVEWTNSPDSNKVTFQFEAETSALLFKLKFGDQ